MAKQLNIDLNIKADVKQAQEAINSLSKSLQDIQNIKNMPMVSDESYKSAASAAKDLERNLQSAVNVDTGKLDLNKFSASLKKSNTSITELAIKLNGAGETGQKAFLNLAKSIALADNSSIGLGNKLNGLMTTLKNTARWQISSSILHGFMGAIQGAYGYAQDLNESLNNIRIVTGQNIDQMAKFAEQANKAAKQLSTTTTEYTDASLIYYQQGLTDAEVKERTDATIKLANVSRQSAEEVSSQMTAIWNNFADGSKKLEYYEDVITALGASTASSSSEISEGLQKFASVADTVGLSYEKAAASVATVVAETRQSADTVGNAFKTIFARIEGLNLGKTLEDGVDLNKYSEALKTVGVNVLDSNNQLKKMDTILDELSIKWNSIGDSQKVALAETVAGVRQYTQFMSLMNNYKEVQKNEGIAENSEGTIEKQQEIYAESWEAARDRVTAALEDIYGQLLDDKAFIGILNGLEKVISFIGNVIEGMGGVKSILLLVGSIFMQQYAKEIPKVFENMVQNLNIIIGRGEKVKQTMLEEVQASLALNKASQASVSQQNSSHEMEAKYTSTQKAIEMTQKLNASMKILSESEKAEYQAKIQQTIQEGEYLAELGKELDEKEKIIDKNSKIIANQSVASYGDQKQTMENPTGLNEDEVSGSSYQEAINEQLEKQKELKTQISYIQNDENNGILDQEKALEMIKEKQDQLAESKKKVIALQQSEKATLNFINGQYKDAVSKHKVISQESKDIVVRTKNWEEAEKNINKLLQGNQQQQKTGKKLSGELAEQMKKYASYLEDIMKKSSGGVLPEGTEEELKNFTQLIEEAKEKGNWNDVFASLKDGGNIYSLLSSAAEEAGISLEQVVQEGEELGIVFDTPEMEELTEDMEEAALTSNKLKIGMESLEEGAKEGLNHVMPLSEGLGKLASMGMQVSMAINGLQNLGNIWSNEDLTTGEKLLQTMTSLGTIVPVLTTLLNKQRLTEVGLTAARLLGIKSIAGTSTAELAKMPIDEAVAATGWAALGPLLLFVAIAGGAIALIMAIVGALNQQSEASKKAESTTKAAQALTEEYSKMKQGYEDLKASIADYQSSLKAIESMTQGTQEWKDAIKNTNEQALKLINSLKLIKGLDYTVDENGLIHIKDSVLKEQQEKKGDETARKQAESTIAQRRMDEAQIEKKKEDDKSSTSWSAAYDQAFKLLSNGGSLSEKFKNNELSNDEIIEAVLKAENKEKNIGYTKEDIKDSKTDQALINTIEKVKSLVIESNKLKDQGSVHSAAASSLVAENEKVQSSSNQKALTSAAGFIYQKIETDLYDKYIKNLKKDNLSRDGAINEYETKAGLKNLKSYNKHDVQADGSFKYDYIDENGQEQKDVEVTADQIATTLAGEKGSEQLNKALEKLDETITKLNASETKGDQALASFLSNQNFEKSDKKTIDSMMADFKNFTENEGRSTEEYLDKAFGDGKGTLTNEEATQLGYDSADAMIKAFTEKRKDIETAWNSIEIDDDKFGLKKADELSLTAAQSIQNNFDKISLGAKGEKGGQEYIDGLNKMLEGIDPEKQSEALEKLGEIDWSNYDAIEQADTILQQFNGDIDTGSAYWKKYADNMRKATGAIPDFSTMKANIAEITKLISGLEFGKTISQEDYETLTKNHEAWKAYFQLQADGTQKFIGDTEELKKANKDSIIDMQNTLNDRKKIQDNFKKAELKNDKGKNIEWDKLSFDTNKEAALQAGQELLDSTDDERVQQTLKLFNYDKKTLQAVYDQAKAGNEQAKKQLAALYQNLSNFKKEEISKDQQQTKEMYAATASDFGDLQQMLSADDGKTNVEALNKQAEVLKQNMLDAAKSVEELDAAVQTSAQYGETFTSAQVSTKEYGEALTNLASQYTNTSKEAEEYKDVLENLKFKTSDGKEMTKASAEALAEATDKLKAATIAGEAASKYSLDAETIEAQSKAIKKVNSDIGMTAEQATKLAVANQRMNAGVKSLHDNFKTWKKTLTTADKTSMDYAQTTADVTKAMRNLLAVSDKWELPDGFLESPKNLELLGKAAKGDEKAINLLGTSCAKASVKAAKFNESIAKAYNKANKEAKGFKKITKESFKEAQKAVSKGIESIQKNINGLVSGTMTLDEAMGGSSESWIENLNKMAKATGMSVDEMNDLLNQIGVTAKVETINVPKEIEIPTYKEYRTWVSEDSTQLTYKDENGEEKKLEKPNGYYQTYTVPGPPVKAEGYEQVAQISTEENPREAKLTTSNAPKAHYTGVGGTANRGSTNRGGGVSKSSTQNTNKSNKKKNKKNEDTTSAASHEHEVYRYTKEENLIEGLTSQYDRLSTAKDRAYGASRIAAIDKEISKLKELETATKKYLNKLAGNKQADKVAKAIIDGKDIGKMIKSGKVKGDVGKDYKALFKGKSASGENLEYVKKDKKGNETLVKEKFSLKALNNAFGSNIKIKLDKFGNIENEDSIKKQIQKLKNKEESDYAKKKKPTAKETTQHNKRLAYLSQLSKRLSQYSASAKKLNEKSNDWLNRIYAIQDKNAEKISTKMSTGVELGQKTIQKLNRALKVLGNSIYKTTEGASKWFNSKSDISGITKQGSSQMTALNDTIAKWNNYKQDELSKKGISPAKAAELFKSIEDGLDSSIETARSWQTDISSYYSGTVDLWREKITEVTKEISQQTKTLDHYQKVLSLLGRSTDYKSMIPILQSQVSTARSTYNINKQDREKTEARLQEALDYYNDQKTQGASQTWLDNYEETVIKKAKEEYNTTVEAEQTSLEDYLTKLNNLHETNVNRIFDEYESALAGKWGDLEGLDNAMKRQKSVAEEYLTETNKLYETNSLLRKLQKDIDKTDSQLAKGKLKAFSDEINALQKKEKLSKTDLEIAKARYEVLQAQIALEEAQNAKSTVRLQRDDEGNYGYVYTADQDKVSEAEQNLADKENALYNIGLNNAQTYTEKLANIGKEYEAEMKKLYEDRDNHKISEEEFQTQLLDIKKKYQELELSYMDSYRAANQVLNEVGAEGQTEAWTNSFDEIISSQRLFNDDSTGIAYDLEQKLEEEFSNFDSERKRITDEANLGNESIKDSVDKITKSVQGLETELTKKDGYLDQMDQAVTRADAFTVALRSQWEQLEDLIGTYSEAADKANDLYNEVTNYNGNSSSNNSSSNNGGNNGSNNSNGGNNGSNNSSNNGNNGSNNSNGGKYSREDYLDYTFSGNGANRVYKIHGKKVGTGPKDNKHTKVIQALINAGIWGKNYSKGAWTVYDPKTKDEVFSSFGLATGGYTGDWSGTDGKLAFLHQKELVLNAADTENILEAVKFIREINSRIDLQALSQSQSLQSRMSSDYQFAKQALQQEVTIHAEFPNATNHNEIEEAFGNLINLASQYANRSE